MQTKHSNPREERSIFPSPISEVPDNCGKGEWGCLQSSQDLQYSYTEGEDAEMVEADQQLHTQAQKPNYCREGPLTADCGFNEYRTKTGVEGAVSPIILDRFQSLFV